MCVCMRVNRCVTLDAQLSVTAACLFICVSVCAKDQTFLQHCGRLESPVGAVGGAKGMVGGAKANQRGGGQGQRPQLAELSIRAIANQSTEGHRRRLADT